jgi:hypothetical protein
MHFGRLMAAIVALPSLLRPATAETFDELKGLSIDAALDLDSWYSGADAPSPERVELRLQIYISAKGNIFQYGTRTSNISEYRFKRYSVTALNQATDLRLGLLRTWTMINGHLTSVAQIVKGYSLLTISVDPARLTCNVDFRDQPDAKTGKVEIYSNNGARIWMVKRRMVSRTCTVKRGNIFGPEQ